MKSKAGIWKKLKAMGPAALVTAAFIGPGTVTTCSIAGAKFGYALLWGLVFSVLATIVLQEMAARLGIVSKKGLGEALHEQFNNPILKALTVILVLSAIVIGNAAYETGNLLGGALGIETITGVSTLSITETFQVNIWGPAIGFFAFVILILGSYKVLEKLLIGLVILMSITFLITAIMVAPSIGEILKGAFVPGVPSGSIFTIVALIGTTVVPYNLFLHASAVQEKWKNVEDLKAARRDTFVSLSLGGIISMSIVITSAAAFLNKGAEISGAGDMAIQLQPILGSWSSSFLGFGFFAAGVSSAVTAPLAAAYAASGILGWKRSMREKKFKIVWMFILGIGIIFSAIGFKPIQVIVFAQVANGILLPIIAVYLLWIMNNDKLLGAHKNGLTSNILGVLVVLVTLGLGVRSILAVFSVI